MGAVCSGLWGWDGGVFDGAVCMFFFAVFRVGAFLFRPAGWVAGDVNVGVEEDGFVGACCAEVGADGVGVVGNGEFAPHKK